MQSRREVRIDFIRGLSLFAIFIGHSGFGFSDAVQHSRGFSDASELFVLLSGISTSLAYYNPARPKGEEIAALTIRRALRLYAIHLAMVAALIAVVLLSPIAGSVAIVGELGLAGFGNDLALDLASVATLSFMPGDLDILPLYVVLLLATPLIVSLHGRSPRLLFAGSVLLWFVGGVLKLDFVNMAAPSQGWYFDPLSWQLIFAVGIALGIALKAGRDPLAYRPWLFAAAAAIALAAIPASLLLHYVFTDVAETGLVSALVSKTYAGPIRLLNAFAVLYVVWNLDVVRRLRPDGALRSIFAVGRASLPVFVTGLVLSTANKMAMSAGVFVPLSAQLALAGIGCLLQIAVATHLRDRRRRPAAAGAAKLGPVATGAAEAGTSR